MRALAQLLPADAIGLPAALPAEPPDASTAGPAAPAGALQLLAAADADGQPLQALRRCALCQRPAVLTPQPDARCPACHSPLAALPGPDAVAHDRMGRRGAVRRDQSHVGLVYVGWPSDPVPVRWRDLSLTGLSLYVPLPLPPGQRLRIVDSAIDGVAEVVSCRPQGRVQVMHGRLLSALLLQSTGVFMSAQA